MGGGFDAEGVGGFDQQACGGGQKERALHGAVGEGGFRCAVLHEDGELFGNFGGERAIIVGNGRERAPCPFDPRGHDPHIDGHETHGVHLGQQDLLFTDQIVNHFAHCADEHDPAI